MEDSFSKLLSDLFYMPDVVLSTGYTKNVFQLPKDLRKLIKLSINKLVRKEIVIKRKIVVEIDEYEFNSVYRRYIIIQDMLSTLK